MNEGGIFQSRRSDRKIERLEKHQFVHLHQYVHLSWRGCLKCGYLMVISLQIYCRKFGEDWFRTYPEIIGLKGDHLK